MTETLEDKVNELDLCLQSPYTIYIEPHIMGGWTISIDVLDIADEATINSFKKPLSFPVFNKTKLGDMVKLFYSNPEAFLERLNKRKGVVPTLGSSRTNVT